MAIRKIPDDTEWFHYHNENPKNNRTNDCVVRTIANATGKSWDEVITDLYNYSIKLKLMPDDKKCYEKYLKDLGWQKMNQPRKADNTKYTGQEFCMLLADAEKVYIAHIGGGHITCIRNNMVEDTWDCSDRCIGNLWLRN